MRLQGMRQWNITNNQILILAPHLTAPQVTSLFQLSHNTLHRALCNTHRQSNLTQGLIRMGLQVKHHMRMIRKKIPTRFTRFHSPKLELLQQV